MVSTTFMVAWQQGHLSGSVPQTRRMRSRQSGRMARAVTLGGGGTKGGLGGTLTADEIAQTAEFFSFGTNDLTQTALGICRHFFRECLGRLAPLRSGSRDDMGNFLNAYVEHEVFTKNPFASLDQSGVGQLVKIAIEKGRKTRPDIKLGI